MYRINCCCRILGLLVVAWLVGVAGHANAQTNSPASQPHLYFFTNPGCAPCRQVEPGIEALMREGYPVTTVILNEQPQLAQQFSVNRTPTVILVANSRIAGRHAGLIDGVTLKKWFAAVGLAHGKNFASQSGGTKVNLEAAPDRTGSRAGAATFPIATRTSPEVNSSTVHHGTCQPSSQAEANAMQATVRLKVEDPEGISYATGTVIHSHQGESLVMTCGHVFRDAQGQGKITAEYGFDKGMVRSAPGRLISYDADARDIGLVVIQADESIRPTPIASETAMIDRGLPIFSVGCDQGDAPTIRRSKIKNRAAYDGSIKYDIYGRPVNGRSGGGLFNQQGELIGICNAAAVEVDEGIYTALDTIHWQIAQVNLKHLFEPQSAPTGLAANRSGTPASGDRFREIPVDGQSQSTHTTNPGSAVGASRDSGNRLIADASGRPGMARIQRSGNRDRGGSPITPVAWDRERASSLPGTGSASEMEVIILVRSTVDPSQTDAITVRHPSQELLNYLATMKNQNRHPREIDVAQLRQRIEFREIE